MGRFRIDTHVHAQRQAAGKRLGGNAIRVFRLADRLPHTRLFRPVDGPWPPES